MKQIAALASTRRSTRNGFSVVELVLSLAVILIIAAVAVPLAMRSLRSYQLNTTASQVVGMLNFTRFEAIRRNTSVRCRIVQTASGWILWADSNGNGQVDATETQILITGNNTLLSAGSAPSPSAIISALGPGVATMPLTVLSGSNGAITYDARGAVGGPPTISVLYLGNASEPSLGYRAVILLPSGVVQMWSASAAGDWQQIS